MSAEMEIYKDKDMVNKIVGSSAFSDDAELEKEAGPMIDKAVKGVKDFAKKDWKKTIQRAKTRTRKTKSWGREIGKDIKKVDDSRKARTLKKRISKDVKEYRTVMPKTPDYMKKKNKELLSLKANEGKVLKKVNKKNKKNLSYVAKRNAVIGAGVGTAGGAYGANEYIKNQNANNLNKEASLDKEAAGLLGLTSGVGKFMTKQRGYGIPGTNIGSKLFKSNRLRSANLAAKATPERAETLKNLTKIRADKATATSQAQARHTAENSGSKGNFAGMEKKLAKRQKSEMAGIDAKYRQDAGMRVRRPKPTTPRTPAGVVDRQTGIDSRRALATQKSNQLKADGYRQARRARDARTKRLVKSQTAEAKGATGLNKADTAALKTKQNQAWVDHNNKYRQATGRKPIPALGPKPQSSVNNAWVKPKAPAPVKDPMTPANNVLKGLGMKMPTTKLGRGVLGAGALTAGSQVYDGATNGNNKRVVMM